MSNFLLGQGPYTPWQMAAWGMRRPVRRARSAGSAGGAWGACRLALACALAALGGEGGDERVHVDDRRQSHTRRAAGGGGYGAAVRSDRHGRELPVRPRFRPRAGAAAGTDARAHGSFNWDSPRPLEPAAPRAPSAGLPRACRRSSRSSSSLTALAAGGGTAARAVAHASDGTRRVAFARSSPS